MTRNPTSPKTRQHATSLRHNQTEAEARLWAHLRQHRLANVHFRRQHPIGPYVADFCAPQEKLIIELDGGQHLDQEGYDASRTSYLEDRGYRVLRFWNNDVIDDLEAVLLVIQREVQGE